MTNIPLPDVINEYPVRSLLKGLVDSKFMWLALKVARNVHIRCRLSEAQNWKCCWCGTDCVPESGNNNSATIEHVQPRSKGGEDHWDNYAMACARCNNKRGTRSIEAMIAGVQDKAGIEELKSVRKTRAEKRFEKYLEKAEDRNSKGWFRADGSVLCKNEWVDSIAKITTEQRNELRDLAMKG
jgi:hypothetical protein